MFKRNVRHFFYRYSNIHLLLPRNNKRGHKRYCNNKWGHKCFYLMRENSMRIYNMRIVPTTFPEEIVGFRRNHCNNHGSFFPESRWPSGIRLCKKIKTIPCFRWLQRSSCCLRDRFLYPDVWWRLLTSADVFWRILTYTDICQSGWRWENKPDRYHMWYLCYCVCTLLRGWGLETKSVWQTRFFLASQRDFLTFLLDSLLSLYLAQFLNTDGQFVKP